MPQFIPKGPVVPDKLVQDLEDDKVVLFCGAGISIGAGLPDYRGLVEFCFSELVHPVPDKKSKEWQWPDRMLGSLEARCSPQLVRRTVIDRLSITPITLAWHQVILKLSKTRRRDGLRLVTTNFDTYFEEAAKSLGLGHEWHSGPVLPIPRNDRNDTWKSLVYLHGRLDQAAPHQMVLTSADFGRAYLTDAWAARFVARLFSDFTVLFIGYSLNDPVLRYMIDAFAAEKSDARFSQVRGPAYIFVPYKGTISLPDHKVYQERNLEPIFYNSFRDHLRLKKTLETWAEWRSDYLANTARLISNIALARPDAIDPTDTANLLWAVAGRPNDKGHGARVFAKVSPKPPIEWLFEFERRERGIQKEYYEACALADRDEQSRPAPPILDFEPLFPIASDSRNLPLTPVADEIVHWLTAHLDSPALIEWVLSKLTQGRRAHATLRRAVRAELIKNKELQMGFSKFWWIVSAEGTWNGNIPGSDLGPIDFVNKAMDSSADITLLNSQILAALRPVFYLTPAFDRLPMEESNLVESKEKRGENFSDLASLEVRLSSEDFAFTLVDTINARADADVLWAGLLDELTMLLRQALGFYASVDVADINSDPGAIYRPSIPPHAQNSGHHSWTILFDLIWRGWKFVDATDIERSCAYVNSCRHVPYLSFRRLVAAAVTESKNFTTEERLGVLLHG